MRRRRRARLAITAAAAAAGILLAVGAVWILSARPFTRPTPFAEDVNDDGRVDVLDPFALARKIESGAALDLKWDFTHDGVVNAEDVDALAKNIVRISRPAHAEGVFDDRQAGGYRTLDIYIDSGPARLAAYQIELNDPTGRMKIIGVEGGEPAAFKAPPYYDPAALEHGRIILAAFSTGRDLPAGKVRVARLRVAVSGRREPGCVWQLCAAGTADGNRIPAQVLIAQGGSELNQRGPAGVGACDGVVVRLAHLPIGGSA
jgi:hypothetical protein